jgi:DNA replication protein DnaC
VISRQQIGLPGDALDQLNNPGPSGSGKSHLSAAFGHALIEHGYRVLFTRTTDLVQRLQQARQALSLESAIEKLDKYHVLILEDLCYVRKDQRKPRSCSS